MNTQTPETDRESVPSCQIYDRYRASNFTEALQWVYADFARKLEQERDEARATIKECVERIRQEESRANGLGNRIAKEKAEADCKRISVERDQLRKVADELAAHYYDCVASATRQQALQAYNSLPHVIAAKKISS